jgi:GNAT superfamily N-acetyltransferase
MLTIVPLTRDNKGFFNQPDARFLAGDRVQLRFTRKGFLPEYTPLGAAEWRTVKPCPLEADALADDPAFACYFAVMDGRCVGQAVAGKGPHRLCELTDLRTDSRYRRQGVATALLDAVVEWASGQTLAGIRVETTDDRPASCQFLERCGFTLGGLDMLWHTADAEQAARMPAMRESVLTFYKFF